MGENINQPAAVRQPEGKAHMTRPQGTDAARLQSKLPPARQALQARVRHPVRIVRDGGWVPHVYAESARDLFFGQGLAMAQDRLWQMDYFRRRALGRLAEVLGPEAVLSDCQSRILGFGRLADQEWDGVTAEAAEALEAFAAGVNAWSEAARANLPIEFDILGYEPETWTPRDSLALYRAFLWQLTGRLENLAAAEAARRVLGEALATDFLTTESPDETILPRRAASAARQRAPAGATGGGDDAGGSNNWAVAPGRSRTGHALLATDPHLPLALPTGLYLAHLSGGGYNVAGATYPGWPGIIFGHNDRIAWGITNLVASCRDLYVETLRPGMPSQYRLNGGWADFDRRIEEIVVKDARPVRLEVRSTVRGPVVDNLVPPLPDSEGTVLSLRWVGQERLGELPSMLDLCRSRDWESFRKAAARWRLPIVNLVYADVDGHIGWQGVGSIPIRGEGERTRGYRPANDPTHEWRGSIAFDDLPRLFDPEHGWIATANNKPVDDDFPQPLYGWWAPGHRAVRLRQLFERQERFTLENFRRMQFDAYSVRAEQAVPALRQRLATSSEPALKLTDLLAPWDYQYRPESAAATVFETFFELWHERVIMARFPDDVRPFLVTLGAGSGLALRLIVEGRPDDWFGDGSLASELSENARATIAELEARLGPDPAAWRWGDVHRISLSHPLDGRPGAGDLFRTPPRPAHGTSHALNNTGYAHGVSFAVTSGPEFRMVVDLGDLDGAGVILTTGQSGQPGSPHYADHLPKWLTGQYDTLPWSPKAVEAAARGELRLEPS
jgi:penicillin amidase